MAIVVVGSALGLSGFHRQNRLAAFQSLHLTFLIHAKHNGMGLFRWVEVKAHDVAHLFHKEGIAGELEVLFPVRLEAGELCQMRLMALWESPTSRAISRVLH